MLTINQSNKDKWKTIGFLYGKLHNV